jgi:hypothetical protein
MKSGWTTLAAVLLLTACTSSAASDYDADEPTGYAASSEDDEAELASIARAEFDEDKAREDARQEAADDGYSGSCTSDCSGHEAGYSWAADDHDDYGTSSSPSFDEGQEAFEEAVEEKLAEKRREFERDGSESEYAR